MASTTDPLADAPNDELCGICSWRPRCLQRLAHHRVFAVSYVIIGVVQGMIFAYFNGVLTTMEKAFGIPSRTMGFILSGNDISQLMCGVLVTYIAGRGSRPAWLATGMLMSAAACFMYATAQLLWDGNVSVANKASHQSHAMCQSDPEEHTLSNHTILAQTCSSYSSNVSVMVIFFLGQFISGVGSATIFTLGLTYMDDSVKKSASPLYLAITGALRSLGPTLGYVMASVMLNIYIDPQTTPEYNRQDPRWLGAWWLGFLIIGCTQLVITFPMLLFPKKLPTRYRNKSVNSDGNKMEIMQEEKLESPSFHDFLATMRRVVQNPLIILHILSIGPLFLGLVGYSTFLPKFLEANFGQTSSQSSLLSGTAGTMMMMAGVFVGGLIIWKFKPRAVYICIASGVVDVIFAIGMFIIMNFKCDNGSFVGVNFDNGNIVMSSNCSQRCDCTVHFDPVCLGSQNYLSPCSAGCQEASSLNDKTVFKNCACAPNIPVGNFNSTFIEESRTARMGYCPGSKSNCDYFWPYISILASMKFLIAATRTGAILVFMRSMEQRDKSVGMALSHNAMSLLGFIPGPIVFGAIADGACMLWETISCGQKGNCWLYNMDELRHWYHGVTITCLFIAGFFEFALSIYARKLNLYSDDPPSKIMSFREGLGWRPRFQAQTSVASGLEIIKSRH